MLNRFRFSAFSIILLALPVSLTGCETYDHLRSYWQTVYNERSQARLTDMKVVALDIQSKCPAPDTLRPQIELLYHDAMFLKIWNEEARKVDAENDYAIEVFNVVSGLHEVYVDRGTISEGYCRIKMDNVIKAINTSMYIEYSRQ